MLLNRYGIPFRKIKKLASVIVCVSTDGHPPWQPVEPANVPEWIKDADTLGNMLREWIDLSESVDEVTTELIMQRIVREGGFKMAQGPKSTDWYIVLPLTTGIDSLFEPKDIEDQRHLDS